MLKMAKSLLYEPEPRFYAAAASVEGQMCIWGGRTLKFESGSKDAILTLAKDTEFFDPVHEVWRHCETQGTPHPGLTHPACTSFGEHLYLYGGVLVETQKGTRRPGHGGALCCSCLNVKTLNWSQLCFDWGTNGPMRKISCGMVHFHDEKLMVIGGYGSSDGPVQRGAKLLVNGRSGKAWTNEVHIFDVRRGMVLFWHIAIVVINIIGIASHLNCNRHGRKCVI